MVRNDTLFNRNHVRHPNWTVQVSAYHPYYYDTQLTEFFIPKIQLLGELPAFKRRVMRPSTPQILGIPSGAMHCHRLIEIRKFGLEIEVGVQKSATKKWDN